MDTSSNVAQDMVNERLTEERQTASEKVVLLICTSMLLSDDAISLISQVQE